MDAFGKQLREIGDFEMYVRTMEADMNAIASSLEAVSQSLAAEGGAAQTPPPQQPQQPPQG